MAHGAIAPSSTSRPSFSGGIGDLIAALLRHCGIASAVHRLFPRGCGCAARQSWLNRHSLHLELAAWLTALLLTLFAALR